MRKFRLINGQGSSFDLNRKDSFFHDIKGFGFADATGYEQIGRDFYPLEEILSQGKIEGKIEDIKDLLADVGTITQTLEDKLVMISDKDIIRTLHKKAARVSSIEEFEEELDKLTASE